MGVEKKVYSFRLDVEMVKQLQYYADKDNRSLSNLVQTILRNYLVEKDRKTQDWNCDIQSSLK